MKVRRRTIARRIALQLLYEEEIRGELSKERISEFLKKFAPIYYISRYVKTLIEGVLSHKKELDEILARFCKEWDYERISPVERSILRLASYEILYGEVPAKSAIEEAVELAKRFANKEAAVFINGILHSLGVEKKLLP